MNFLAVADTLYSRVITTFLFAKVASAGMTAKHRCPIFPDSLWQPSHFIAKMGIPYTLPKNYLLFIPMALTAFLGKEKVYTRQNMGIKKSSHESSNRTKEKCLTTLRKSINFFKFHFRTPTDGINGIRYVKRIINTLAGRQRHQT